MVHEEVTSKKKVIKKEQAPATAIEPGMHKKAPARRVPMSKPRKVPTKETTHFTLEHSDDDEAVEDGKKRKERIKKTMARVIGKPSIMRVP